MYVALAAVALLPGLAVGSFLNVVAARIPLRRSIMFPGSACMFCRICRTCVLRPALLSLALVTPVITGF